MSIYIQGLEIQENKLKNERAFLIQQLELMNKQLHKLQVEKMQLLLSTNKHKNLSTTSVIPIETNNINLDNASEINTKPVSLNASAILNDMFHGQLPEYEIDDMEEKDDD